ncbi:uncharacterized protein [Oscarella lobularis]|uniref:uncharacterized protein n=1 Tax=Oscarella lobularis TaxID=121494 RepID=UPI003313D003
MDTEYLKATVGDVLAVGLAEIAVVKPTDPVEYLSRWLANHKKIQERAVENKRLEDQLKEERALKEIQDRNAELVAKEIEKIAEKPQDEATAAAAKDSNENASLTDEEKAVAQAEPEKTTAEAEPEKATAPAEPEKAAAQAEPEKATAPAEPEKATAQAEPEQSTEEGN